ncbi:MAG: hypothetical protein L0241_11930 [Planctomycetia bacterium]|nr:hypothetical protein [Planctomycetia bacterium]
MLKTFDPSEAEPIPPQCRATVELLQRVLDGDERAESLDADPHPAACLSCRERLRAARVLLSALSVPNEPVSVPVGFTDTILSAVKADQRYRARRRAFATVGGLAVAAALVIGVWFIAKGTSENPNPNPNTPQQKEVVGQPTPVEIAPDPRPKTPDTAPDPRPIRIGDELKSGLATLEPPKPLTDSVALAPKLVSALTDPFTKPATPMGADLEPARKSISALPTATSSGLEPVTDTAQKAFARFLRDVGSVQPKPN